MSYYSEKKKARRKEIAALFGLDEDALSQEDPQSKLIASIYAQYPGVPEPYPLVWDRSDMNHPQNDEWHEMLQDTSEALRRAADICDQISAQTSRAQRNELIVNKNTLLCGIHKAEDLVEQLSFRYPLGNLRNYQIAKSNPEIASSVPEILINSDERILIWMPRLPSKSRGVDSMVFQELQEMIWDTDFAHFSKWHCDFIHVYHPDDASGTYDVDNYAYKPIIDALARALHANDNLDRFSCSMFNHESESIKNGTYIHVYKREEKVQFFDNFEELITTLNWA